MKTEKQLKSFRIELQKTQEQQEQRRIQQETAKVFLGTVIQRGETNTRLLKTIRLRLIFKKMHFLSFGIVLILRKQIFSLRQTSPPEH